MMISPNRLLFPTHFLKQGSLLHMSQGFVQGSHCCYLGIGILLPTSPPLPFPNPSNSNHPVMWLKAPTRSFLPMHLLHDAHRAFTNLPPILSAMSSHGKAKPTLRRLLFWPPRLTRFVGWLRPQPACFRRRSRVTFRCWLPRTSSSRIRRTQSA